MAPQSLYKMVLTAFIFSVPSFSQFYPKQLVANALAFGVGCIESQDIDVAIDALFSNVNSNRLNTV